MGYSNWQQKKIRNSKNHQKEIFNVLNNLTYTKRINKKITLDDNKEYIEYISCSYLGLDQDNRLTNNISKQIESSGLYFSSARSRMKYAGLNTLEALINDIFGAHTVIFSTTHLAHLGLIPLIASGEMPSIKLANNGCSFILDTSVHASIQINRGLMQQFGQVEIIDFNNMELLETKLKESLNSNKTPFMLSDSIGSMGGKLPLENLIQLAQKYNGYLYLDDAHGMSIYGKNGAGYVMQVFNHALPERLILTTSLGKAFGITGGLVILKNKNDADFVKMYSSPYMFSGSLLNPLINAGIESGKIHLSEEIGLLQKKLFKQVALFDRLIENKSTIINSGINTPIRGLFIGDESKAISKGLFLKANGILAAVATYPIRKKGEAIIRFLLCANHSDDEIHQTCKIINMIN